MAAVRYGQRNGDGPNMGKVARRKRSAVHSALANPQFRQRIVRSKKIYSRKNKDSSQFDRRNLAQGSA